MAGPVAAPLQAATVSLACVLVLVSIVLAAASRIKSEWQDKPLSKRQLWWLRTFCSPLYWRSLFRASMRRELDRNPITWLQYYSTWDRVAKLIWCGLAVMLNTHLVTTLGQIPDKLFGLEALFALALAYTAASSFRRERQNGAFELILVSPMARNDIIAGRLRAIRAQFFPAAFVLFLPWPWLATLMGDNRLESLALLQCAFIWATYWSLPIVGLYFALGSRSFLKALLNTCVFGLAVPYALTQTASFLLSQRAGFEEGCGLALIYQIIIVALLSGTLPQQFNRFAALPSRG